MNWSLEKVVRQAVVLYEAERVGQDANGDVHGENFWRSHRDTAIYALRGTATPVSQSEVEDIIEAWNHEPVAPCASADQSKGDE